MKDNQLLDELVKGLTGLPENPTYDEVLAAAERVRKENHTNKKHMVKVDKLFYDFLQKKDQP